MTTLYNYGIVLVEGKHSYGSLKGLEMITVDGNRYTEDSPNIKRVRLSNEAYGEAMRRFIGVCTDVVLYNNERRVIFLAQRVIKPWRELWIIGGGQLPGQTKLEAVAGHLANDTSLEIDEGRFILIRPVVEFFWPDREQEPQDVGHHIQSSVFGLEVTDEEIGQVILRSGEYDPDLGLQEFDMEALVGVNVHPLLIELHQTLFP